MSEKKSLSPDEIVMGRTLSRRSIAKLGAAVTGSLATLGILSTTACCFGGAMGAATTHCSDNDPSDGVGSGTHCTTTGCTDSDAGDGLGAGRSCGGTVAPGTPTPTLPTTGAPPTGSMRRSCSDSDPNDPAGHGRTC